MILQNWPMNFRGTIKHISPKQAKRMFNYDMPPDAKGVTFQYRNNKTIIVPYYPEKHITPSQKKSPEFRQNIQIFSNLGKISHQIRTTIIYPIWTKTLERDAHSSPYHTFMSVNYRQLLSGIENILFTVGNLNLPEIDNTPYLKAGKLKVRIKNFQPGYQLGIIIMDSQTLRIKLIPPAHYNTETISIPIKIPNPLVFLYYKKDKNFSPSVNIPITNYQITCPLKRA
ncbi:MAG: hypothetical protein PHX21_11150 [bacterium]|nr:hypothetical protein [bacterium]